MRYKKRTRCPYCKDVITNFDRHLIRNHKEEKEVQEMIGYSPKSKQRKEIIALLRNDGHFQEYLVGNVLPTYRPAVALDLNQYIPCGYCKGIFKKTYLSRHAKKCKAKEVHQRGAKHMTASQTLIASASDFGSALSKMRVTSEVFSIMKPDEISLVAKTDPLIVMFGENYLKKHKRPQTIHCCSNKMRELARLLIDFHEKTGKTSATLIDLLDPTLFDQIINCVKNISGYNETTKTFRAPSLSAHIGTSLKQMSDICLKLLWQQNKLIRVENPDQKATHVKLFRKLVESQWTTEISSLAIKDLNEKKWQKKTVLPLTKDVQKFKEFTMSLGTKSQKTLVENANNAKAYKNLVQSVLALTVLFNRRRIGDVQYLKIAEYLNNMCYSNLDEFEISQSEKILTKQYKRVVTGGKGSRKIVILFPPELQGFIQTIIDVRNKTNLVPLANDYLFALPGTKKWARADVAIRQIATSCGLEPDIMSSNKLRKQIATVMQLLNLSKTETRQFAQFMGHTEKTHEEFYVLPQDLYQTAKVSKLLIMIDRGEGKEHLGKSLADINIDPSMELAETEQDCDNPTTEPINDECDFPLPGDGDTNGEQQSRKLIPGRVPWSKLERDTVIKYFSKHIRNKIAPKKKETNEFKEKYPNLFYDKDWVKIKTFVYNQYRDK